MNPSPAIATLSHPSRRSFLKLTVAARLAGLSGLRGDEPGFSAVRLGLVNHSLRTSRWNAARLLHYAAGLNLDSLLLNTLNNFESLETAHLESLKRSADEHAIQILVGAGGISKKSVQWKGTHGEPEQVIETGIRVAKAVGSPVVNVRIGNVEDRFSDGGIEAHIEASIKVLQATKSRVLDAGLKIGFENHAGDLRSQELLEIIDVVGSDVCGVLLDPGNAIVALEDPMKQVEILGKHTVCTSIRDYMIWPSEGGVEFQWTAVGEGLMDVRTYVQRLNELAPGVAINVETISNGIRSIPFLTEEYLNGFPKLSARDLADFIKLVRRGRALPIDEVPPGVDARTFAQDHQRREFEKSIAFLREICG
jgi:sugar phosphate isomerase/epimerase